MQWANVSFADQAFAKKHSLVVPSSCFRAQNVIKMRSFLWITCGDTASKKRRGKVKLTHQVRSYCLNLESVIDGQKSPSTVPRPSPDSRVPKKRYVLQLTDVHVKIITAGASIHRWDKYHSTTLSNVLLFGCYYVLEELLLLTLKVHISETKANEKNISKEVDAPWMAQNNNTFKVQKGSTVHSHS